MNILYNTIFMIALVLYLPLFIPILFLSKKRRKTVLQRFGLVSYANQAVSRGKIEAKEKPIWIHALSVGEVISAEPLAKKIFSRFKDRKIVFSVSTQTGYETASALIKPYVSEIFYFPYDLPFSVRRTLEKISPGSVIIVESDIWPNFMHEIRMRKIKTVFVNGRISDKSFSGYKRFSPITRPMFASFSAVCPQSREDANRLIMLGVPGEKVTITGNMKFDQEVYTIEQDEINLQKQCLKIQSFQPVLVAGSTHLGEEIILLEAFEKLKKHFPDLVLMIAPRDIERAGSVFNLARSKGFLSCFFTRPDAKDQISGPEVIVVDVMGVLKKLYALADIAFIGGSLVNCGGHNPLEPAAYAKPILFGEYMSDFQEIAEMLIKAGGAIAVHNATKIYEKASLLLKDPKRSSETGRIAQKIFSQNKGAVDKTVSVIEDLLLVN